MKRISTGNFQQVKDGSHECNRTRSVGLKSCSCYKIVPKDGSIVDIPFMHEKFVVTDSPEAPLVVTTLTKELRMEFKYKVRKVSLRGTKKPTLLWMPNAQLSSMVLCVYPSTTLHMMVAEEFDHKIVLKEGTTLTFSGPYRHPPTQKDAIEAMVKELIESGVIRPSQSPFSSPVIVETWTTDSTLAAIVQNLKAGYSWSHNQLRRKGKLVVGNDADLRVSLVTHFHCDSIGGNSRVAATTQRIQISMDFIEGLSNSHVQVAQLFLDNIYKLHGLPMVIVSDRDKELATDLEKRFPEFSFDSQGQESFERDGIDISPINKSTKVGRKSQTGGRRKSQTGGKRKSQIRKLAGKAVTFISSTFHLILTL
nr:protein CYPRO4-like [Tanacetum cinerariifolium]